MLAKKVMRNGTDIDNRIIEQIHEAVRIIKEMRGATNGEYPRFIVWENVEGAYSSNSGEDFRTVLEEICKIKNSSLSVPRPPERWTKAGEIVGGFSGFSEISMPYGRKEL